MATRADALTMEGRQLMREERLARIDGLDVWPERRGVYTVTGGTDPDGHTVDFRQARATCTCGDFIWRRTPCKHLLVAQLARCNGVVEAAFAWAEAQEALEVPAHA